MIAETRLHFQPGTAGMIRILNGVQVPEHMATMTGVRVYYISDTTSTFEELPPDIFPIEPSPCLPEIFTCNQCRRVAKARNSLCDICQRQQRVRQLRREDRFVKDFQRRPLWPIQQTKRMFKRLKKRKS